MADAHLTVGVQVKVQVDEATALWLESQGWVRPERAEQDGITTRVFAGLHESAESDVSRVIELYERWVAEGAPPLGTPLARWWDKKLVELGQVIRPPEPAEDDDDYDPLPMELSPMSDISEIEEALPRARPLRAMGGAEAMRYRAARLRRDLMNELSSPERVDEMLRLLDIDPDRLPDPDCDC